ncbi:MAG: NAD(P)H-hydrate epimerase [Eubacteriales bacterium]|nr:NAD(P)H-hydrate epimerase [Eubacteriales bacterium]
MEVVKTVSVETMRYSDAWTIEHLGISSKELMLRAGQAIFDAGKWKGQVAIVCGKGNNGGDGYVVAKLMREAGIECCIYLLGDSFSEDGRYYYDAALSNGIRSEQFTEATDLSAYGSILDCILGTGFKGEVSGITRAAIEAINAAGRSGAYVVSADINSGLNGNTGTGACYVVSDLTVSIGNFKHGHFCGDADRAMKEKVNADIGIVIQQCPGC